MVEHLSDDDFDALEDDVERRANELAAQEGSPPDRHDRRFPEPAPDRADFEQLVRDALDELPADVLADLKDVAVVVSDNGAGVRRYGEYLGGGVRASFGSTREWAGTGTGTIVIYRDTLVRDFGADQQRLRDQVRRTVRHEVAHHLGFDEASVRRLGL